jgi:hypothetical protein
MLGNIIGHWKLNEASGIISTDSTSHGNHGTVVGTSVETGLFGNCRVFYPSSEDRIEIGDVGLFKFRDSEFTISAWMKKTNDPAVAQGIISKWDATSNNRSWRLVIQTDGTIDFDTSDNGTSFSTILSSPLSVTDGCWHLLVVSRSGNDFGLYLDGALLHHSSSGPASLFNSSAPLVFGNFSESSAWDSSFDGYISNVRIYNYELNIEEVNDLFYDTGYDRFPPWFEAVSPLEGETGVLVNEDIVFRYLDENTNLNTLNMTINGYPIIVSGVTQDGYDATVEYYTEGLSDGYDGYEITVSHEGLPLPPRSEILIELDAADAYGAFTIYQYNFFTASDYDPPPSFDNLNPLPNTIGLNTSDYLYFQFNDGYNTGPDLVSGSDLSTLFMYINNETIISNGVIQSGYSGSLTSNEYSGYNVIIYKNNGWPVAETLEIGLNGNDINGTGNSFTYFVKVGGGPHITNISPEDLSTSVDRNSNLSFTIRDAIWGIDKTGINLNVLDTAALINGSAVNGYSVVYSNITDGYNITIGHETWPEYSDITVDISITNRINEITTHNFSFYTKDETPPAINLVVPTDGARRVNINSPIEFVLLDGYSGIDAYSLDLTIDGSYAILNGWAQDDYTVDYEQITDGYYVTVQKLSSWQQMKLFYINISIYDFEDNVFNLEYNFSSDDALSPIFTNLSPDDGDKALPITNIDFDVHDSGGSGVNIDLLNVNINSIPVIVNGVYQTSITGIISVAEIDNFDGYHVHIDPNLPFDLGSTVNIHIDVKDAYGLDSEINYSFIVDDEGEPIIAYVSPEIGSVSSLRPYIRFKIHDSGGTGVDPSRLDVTVDGTSAIIDGIIATNFSGSVDVTTVDNFDGYNIWIRYDKRFEASTTHWITIDGYDVYDNHAHLAYQFTTTDDTTVPTFDEFNPEPGETSVDRNTSIFFEFNDNDGSTFLSNINTLNVFIDGNQAILNGQIVNNYTADITQNANDGYDFQIHLPSDLPEYEWINVELDGYDEADNFTSYEYSFRTRDETIPVIDNLNPSPGDIGVHPNTNITFDLIDGYSGIDLLTLNMLVGNHYAIVDGVATDGYSLEIIGIQDGYSVSVIDSDLNEWCTADVIIFVDDNEGNQKWVNYSFDTADTSGPDFDAIYPEPYSIDIDNHFDIRFYYIDPHSGPDLDALSVKINDQSIVTNGIPEFGMSMTSSAIQNGFNIEIGEIITSEGEEVEVEIDGYDISGNRSTYTYILTTAFVRPQFVNLDPGDGSVSQSLDTDITFDVIDAYGINISTLDILINNAPAVLDGIPLDGYNLTVESIEDGYTVYLHFLDPFGELEVINVGLYCEDNNGISGTLNYSFKTWSSLHPEFVNIYPAQSSVDQSEDQNITFKINDPASNGIYPESVDIYVNFVPAMIDGVSQDGYSVELFEDGDGYGVIVEHDRFTPYSRVYVGIFATNIDGNSSELEYYYDVGEIAYPDVVNQNPAPQDINVARSSDICFDLIDYTDVDFYSIEIKVNGKLAFSQGSFTSGFDDTNSSVDAIYDLEAEYFPDLNPVWLPVSEWFPGQPFYYWYYTEDGYIEVDGYTDGYTGYDGYQLDGYIDDGYDGYIPADTIGYRFCIDKRVDFQFGETVNIEVYSCDTLGNCGTRSYYFTILPETDPPIFINTDPYPDEQDVQLNSSISFTVRDQAGSGINLDSLLVNISNQPAMAGNQFQDGYHGSIVFIGDGYDITIDPDNNLPNYENINVSLYVEDYVSNAGTLLYHFRTLDENAPVFEHIFPYPSQENVPTDTAIRFEFNDVTDSGTNISTLNISMQGTLVVVDGSAQDGYDIEIWHNEKDGYNVQLFMPSSLPEYRSIPIILSGYDNAGNFGNISYNWITADETPPEFDNLVPSYPGSKISGTDPIFVDIIEPNSGLDINSLGVEIDGISIIDSGITQPTGFVTELTPIHDGYRLYIQSVGPLPHELDSDTVALWRMNDTTLNIANATGDSSLNGISFGTESVSGKFGLARNFNNPNDRIMVSADDDLALQDITIEAWIKPTSLTDEHTIYTYNPRQTITLSRGIVVKVTSNGSLVVDLGDGNGVYRRVSTTTGLISTNVYTHIGVAISTTENIVRLIINGQLCISTECPVNNIEYNDGVSGSPVASTVLIGNRISPFTGAYIDVFVGDIDEIIISKVNKAISSIVKSYNRSLSVPFSEYQLVPVNIFARDISGNDGYIDYSFYTLDETPPVFSNFSPSPGSNRVDTNTNIAFEFTDAHSGPDIDSLGMIVDNKIVVKNGLGVNDNLVMVSTVDDGYRVEVDLDYPLPEFKNIIVVLDGYDIDPNQTVETYWFSTDDQTEPVLTNEIPLDGSIDVTPFTDIIFDIHDYGGSGLDESTVNVQIDDCNAIINGVHQQGWNVSKIQTWVDGYDAKHYVISRNNRYALDSTIRVLVDGYDAYGNFFETDFAFVTHEDILPPEIVNLSPEPNEIEVALNKDIEFDIIDGYDIDIDNLYVHVDNIPAIINGEFQSGFSGPSSGILGTNDGYSVVIDPISHFSYNQQITVTIDGYDLTGNHIDFEYYFYTIADVQNPIISDRVPDDSQVEVALDSDIEFNITDTKTGVDMTMLSVYVDGIPAISEGIIQSGWNGTSSGIESIVDGYHVVLDPTGSRSFIYNQIHSVTVDGYDHALNHVHSVYSFATIADLNIPSISNTNPSPFEDELPVATDITFDITDGVSGVDMTRLNVYVNGIYAITDGIIKYPFSDTNSRILPVLDGYRIVLDKFVDFDYHETVEVQIDGYDYADNHLYYDYWFITKVDVNGPTITPTNPIGSHGDYERDTDIVLIITDDETGVDLESVDITIDGSLSMENGEFIPGSGFDGGYGYILQLVDGYEIKFDPVDLFPPSYDVRIIVDGYDFVGNQTHYEYVFTTVDDEGPFVFDFSPIPNSVNVYNDPVHISFGIRDYGDGEVDLSTLLIEISHNIGSSFETIYEPVNEFQNGWAGDIINQPDSDGYIVNMYKTEQGESFAVYSVKVTAYDNYDNLGISLIGKEQEYVATTTGTVVPGNKLSVGEEFINNYGIENGDLAVIDDIGQFVIDGYDGDDIIFVDSLSAGGTQTINIYRGSFMLERRIFEPSLATATSLLTVDLTYSDPYKLTGSVLVPTAYDISGGDYLITVTDVDAVNDDTVELTLGNNLQSDVLYTITVDPSNIYNLFSFSIDDGYESTNFVGYPDLISPRVVGAIVYPYNINVTVIFDDYMLQDETLTDPSSYILSHGAYVTSVTTDPTELDRVTLTVENMYNREWFDIFVVGRVRDKSRNIIDSNYNHAIIRPEYTDAALSGITGRIKTRNKVRRLHEDDTYWYVGTIGGLDIVSKIELENKGFILDGYGFNAIATDDNYIYFGGNDGYDEDAYGVLRLSFNDLNGNCTSNVHPIFNTPEIQSNEINDLSRSTNVDKNIIAIATTNGASVAVDGYVVQYSTGYNITAIQLDDGGNTLYIGNNSLGRIEVYYNINSNTTSNINPDAYYSTTTSPELTDGNINQIKIINNGSIIDTLSNVIYIATDNGLTRIDTDESCPGISENNGFSLTYGTQNSGMVYEILGGQVNRIIAVDINLQQMQLFVLTDDSSHNGGLTVINMPSNTQFSFSSTENGGLISKELSDLTFKNL